MDPPLELGGGASSSPSGSETLFSVFISKFFIMLTLEFFKAPIRVIVDPISSFSIAFLVQFSDFFESLIEYFSPIFPFPIILIFLTKLLREFFKRIILGRIILWSPTSLHWWSVQKWCQNDKKAIPHIPHFENLLYQAFVNRFWSPQKKVSAEDANFSNERDSCIV